MAPRTDLDNLAGGGGTIQNANLSIQATDEGAVAGDARGASAVDLQTERAASTQVASGANSFIGGGERNTASGANSMVPGGYQNVASSTNAYASGYRCTASNLAAIAEGYFASATHLYSKASGIRSTTIINSDDTFGHEFIQNIWLHKHNVALGARLESSAEAELTARGAGNRIPIAAGTSMAFSGKAVMRNYEGENALLAEWKVEGIISRTTSGSVVMDSYSPTQTVNKAVATFRGEADTVNESLAFFASSADAAGTPDRVLVGLLLKLERM